MNSVSFCACPRCADGGRVKVVSITDGAESFFSPLPRGWTESVYVFQCECGWMSPLEPPVPPETPPVVRRGRSENGNHRGKTQLSSVSAPGK